tara:strand:- start:55 stop:441 length:387 start_codon:yes stop_codon:yes gene_type:complete
MTNSEIREWLHAMGVYDYDICDGVVHVVGDVNIAYRGLTSIPVQFGYVSGEFICADNVLDSLEGCPSEVGGGFYCGNNDLTSLEGCPKEVGGNFSCRWNRFAAKPDVSGILGKPYHSHIKIGGEFIWE